MWEHFWHPVISKSTCCFTYILVMWYHFESVQFELHFQIVQSEFHFRCVYMNSYQKQCANTLTQQIFTISFRTYKLIYMHRTYQKLLNSCVVCVIVYSHSHWQCAIIVNIDRYLFEILFTFVPHKILNLIKFVCKVIIAFWTQFENVILLHEPLVYKLLLNMRLICIISSTVTII